MYDPYLENKIFKNVRIMYKAKLFLGKASL